MNEPVKYLLSEDPIPKFWYNLTADLPSPPPPVLHPGTKQPVGPDDLAPLFPMPLIAQEVSSEREIEIPGPVRDVVPAMETDSGIPGKAVRRRGFITNTKA